MGAQPDGVQIRAPERGFFPRKKSRLGVTAGGEEGDTFGGCDGRSVNKPRNLSRIGAAETGASPQQGCLSDPVTAFNPKHLRTVQRQREIRYQDSPTAHDIYAVQFQFWKPVHMRALTFRLRCCHAAR